MNLKRAGLGLFAVGLLFSTPVFGSGGEDINFFDPVPYPISPSTSTITPVVPAVSMESAWGFGASENRYNEMIAEAVATSWTAPEPLNPRLFKALIAVESAFKPHARSWAGATGLTQLMPEAAERCGLTLYPVDQRKDPAYALPAGVMCLQEKHAVVMDPLNYWSYLGQPERCEDWNVLVHQAYQQYGPPEGEDRYYLMLGAYNGGGGTILRAMAKAHKRGLDPRKWSNLVGPTHNPRISPLYAACVEIYRGGAWGKYQEISRYPVKIFHFYRQ